MRDERGEMRDERREGRDERREGREELDTRPLPVFIQKC